MNVNKSRWLIVASVGIGLMAFIVFLCLRLPATSEAIPGLKSPERLTLYSIDGTADKTSNQDASAAAHGERFGGYPVLGKIGVTDPKQRAKLVARLQDAMIHNDGVAAKCFWPRHAILATENGKTFEIVICFQCRQYMLNGKGFPLISQRPEELFNDYLCRSGVPIAP